MQLRPLNPTSQRQPVGAQVPRPEHRNGHRTATAAAAASPPRVKREAPLVGTNCCTWRENFAKRCHAASRKSSAVAESRAFAFIFAFASGLALALALATARCAAPLARAPLALDAVETGRSSRSVARKSRAARSCNCVAASDSRAPTSASVWRRSSASFGASPRCRSAMRFATSALKTSTHCCRAPIAPASSPTEISHARPQNPALHEHTPSLQKPRALALDPGAATAVVIISPSNAAATPAQS